MKTLTPMKAIREKCLDCSCGQVKEVRECWDTACPLYLYRMGCRPKAVSEQPQAELSELRASNEGVFHAGGHDGEVSS